MNLEKVYNGAIAGTVLSESFNGSTKPKGEEQINQEFVSIQKIR